MRDSHPIRATRLILALLPVLLPLAAPLAGQAPQWKLYGSPADGFHALFPSQPTAGKSNVPADGDNFELRSYEAEVGATALYIGVCDYGAKGAAADPGNLLASAKKGAVDHMEAHIVSEKKLDVPGAARAVTFEAENDKMHFSVRMYIAAGVLYQAMVATPLHESFADADRFLDSFEIIPRPAQPATQAAWKPYRYPADGFSASFPSEPNIAKQNISTDAGQFELRTYIVENLSAAFIAATCNYGASAQGKDPGPLLESAKKGAIANLKAHLISEKNIRLGANPGVAFEADSDVAHVSARIYLAGTTLYQTIVVSPLNQPYAGASMFLDSFQLIGNAPQ